MTREEYEVIINEKLTAVKQELMTEYKEEEPSIDGWKAGDKYYVRVGDHEIRTETIGCYSDGKIYNYDVFNITHGYAKRTSAEVEFQIERDAVLYELSKFAEPEDREWDGSLNDHWYMYWNCSKDEIKFDFNYKNKHNDIYFASREDAEKAIQAVGEERVKKYYLEVGEC